VSVQNLCTRSGRRKSKKIKDRHNGRLINKGMLAACYRAYIVTAYMEMTVGRNGDESERYSNGTPADVDAECHCIEYLWENIGHSFVFVAHSRYRAAS
jgi:hypothetical protein